MAGDIPSATDTGLPSTAAAASGNSHMLVRSPSSPSHLHVAAAGVWGQAGSCLDTDRADSLQEFKSCDLYGR